MPFVLARAGHTLVNLNGQFLGDAINEAPTEGTFRERYVNRIFFPN
jgi:hypothetical protein